jgi:hypothetical protein
LLLYKANQLDSIAACQITLINASSLSGTMSSNTLEKMQGTPVVEATAKASVITPSVDPETDSVEKNENFLPFGPKLYAIVASLMLGVFCMALDNTASRVTSLTISPYPNTKFASRSSRWSFPRLLMNSRH